MRIGYTDSNDCDFTIVISDDNQKDKAIECMERGIDAWYCAAHPNTYDRDDFTREEVEGFYWDGYAEPTKELLKREGIEFELVDDEYDEDGHLIADEIING